MLAIVGRQTPLVVDFGARHTGLATVGYAILNSDGSVLTARTTTGVANVAAGIYRVRRTFPAGFNGMVVWDTGEEPPRYATEEIETVNLDFLDVAVSTRATVVNLGNATIEVIGPVSTTEGIQIVAGDDYLAVDGRALVWKDVTGTRWPALSGATATLSVTDEKGARKFDAPGSITHPTGEGKEVTVGIAGSLTKQWLTKRSRGRYKLVAILLDGSTVTLAQGEFTIVTPYGP